MQLDITQKIEEHEYMNVQYCTWLLETNAYYNLASLTLLNGLDISWT
jgi:hypothetical protein